MDTMNIFLAEDVTPEENVQRVKIVQHANIATIMAELVVYVEDKIYRLSCC
ncbi:Uncharacterised protein [Bergeyella zoohelcum]|uniref:Uncharacterized protein n=1 Tax=Bergeyella zoohelcum TaxID=1015 RepID=A0A7Z8YPH4_9FLAO|nr:Uncharacterised protein [Bergeyella zoohelcum]